MLWRQATGRSDLHWLPDNRMHLSAQYAAFNTFFAILLHLRRVQGPVSGPLPANYSSWTRLRAFEISNTKLTGTIPEAYFSSWLQLENFTIDGASLDGQLPPPWQCVNLRQYIVQITPVTSNATHPVWVLDARAANLTQMTGLGLGECCTSLIQPLSTAHI